MSTIVIGRGSDSHLKVEDDTISRRHATVRMLSDDLIEVVDERSANGTFLLEPKGWQRIERGMLRPRGQLKLGAVVFTFEELVKRLTQLRPRRNPRTGQIVKD